MADALVFGGPNHLASKAADSLSSALRVPVRYQHSLAENSLPGVAICTTREAFDGDAPCLVFADGLRPNGSHPDPDREHAFGLLARAVAAGRNTVILGSESEASHWHKRLTDDVLPASRPLRRLMITGEAGVGKTTLAERLSPALGIPLVSIDQEFWSDDDAPAGQAARIERLEKIAAQDLWITDAVYYYATRVLGPRADAIIHLDLHSKTIKRQRESRGPATGRRWPQRLVIATLRKSYPIVFEPLVRRELSAAAHLAPVFHVRNEREREAVTTGLLSAAAAVSWS